MSGLYPEVLERAEADLVLADCILLVVISLGMFRQIFEIY